MKNKVQYIVVHSTQTSSAEMYYAFPFHYLIHRNGKITRAKKVTKKEESIHIAYIGGIDQDKSISDTRTVAQNETLFKLLFLLSEKHPNARIFGSDEILGKSNDPGFNVRAWLKTYLPQSILSAA